MRFKKMWAIGLCLALILSLSACSNKNDGATTAGNELTLQPGTYEGQGEGHGGIIKVAVTVDEHSITKVEVLENSETASIATNALTEIPEAIISNQSVAVDSISGATEVSEGIKEAAKNALILAGATESQISKTVTKANEGVIETLEADVIVVGAGGSGVAAAVTAAEHGAKVIVLEKTAISGGTTANGGGFFAADSEMSREIGQEALDVDVIFDKWMQEMDWKANANLVKQYLELSMTTADWLQDHGVTFHKMEEAVQQSHEEGTNGYHKYNDYTQTSSQLGAMLDKIVEDNGAQVLYETPAIDLIVSDNIVTGVVAKAKDGTTYEITGKSIIIASGGFVGNDEMVTDALGGVSVNAGGYNTNVGDGIQMGLSAGAATRGMDAMVTHLFSVAGSEVVQMSDYDFMEYYQGTNSVAYVPIIPWLDAVGFRYANEDIVYDRALSTNALIAQGDYAWFIYNENLLNTLEQSGAKAAGMTEAIAMGPMPEITPINRGWGHLTEIVDKMVDSGAVKKADTLEELSTLTGMDVNILTETMNKYNEDAEKEIDTQFGKDGAHMFPLTEGPYYAFKVSATNLCTVGGLRINPNFQVVMDNPESGYTPIENLYCAGADAGGIYSDHYAHTIEGAAQGWAYNSGRLAGARATENALDIKIDLLKE